MADATSRSLGAVDIPRSEYLRRLSDAVDFGHSGSNRLERLPVNFGQEEPIEDR